MNLVWIKWIDSGLSFAPTWLSTEQIMHRQMTWSGKIESVGQVVHEDDRSIVLGISYDAEQDSWASVFLIHKSSIVERQELFTIATEKK